MQGIASSYACTHSWCSDSFLNTPTHIPAQAWSLPRSRVWISPVTSGHGSHRWQQQLQGYRAAAEKLQFGETGLHQEYCGWKVFCCSVMIGLSSIFYLGPAPNTLWGPAAWRTKWSRAPPPRCPARPRRRRTAGRRRGSRATTTHSTTSSLAASPGRAGHNNNTDMKIISKLQTFKPCTSHDLRIFS